MLPLADVATLVTSLIVCVCHRNIPNGAAITALTIAKPLGKMQRSTVICQVLNIYGLGQSVNASTT